MQLDFQSILLSLLSNQKTTFFTSKNWFNRDQPLDLNPNICTFSLLSLFVGRKMWLAFVCPPNTHNHKNQRQCIPGHNFQCFFFSQCYIIIALYNIYSLELQSLLANNKHCHTELNVHFSGAHVLSTASHALQIQWQWWWWKEEERRVSGRN